MITTGALAAKRGTQSASEREALQEQHKQALRIPRRPEWTRDMTREQVLAQEQAMFLAWRKQLAKCVLRAFSAIIMLQIFLLPNREDRVERYARQPHESSADLLHWLLLIMHSGLCYYHKMGTCACSMHVFYPQSQS